ncbi:hypothetical protein KVR01_000034 [Diaporthe batatas]|uniref:uncharacterized protein n=1 Tax=Diaporthe batatas TaxID=748121 RepID=UPI001D036B1B|nr:uncharacterized protein KVR01_000034 [Diaporthe batatas]KAG8169289.1 hypothetical protein KVR01_000034 [Diaporthe batatas]
MVVVCVCYGIAGVFATIFFCIPISGFWNPSPTDKCISREGLWLAHSGINIVTDVIIFLIPVPTVLKLNMNSRQKIAVIGVFCVGIIVCLITMLRLNSIITIARTSDATFDNVAVAVWSNAEMTTAIFCATLSGIKPFVQWVSTRRSPFSRKSYSFQIPGTPFNSGNHHLRRGSKMMTPGGTLGSEPSTLKLNTTTKDEAEEEERPRGAASSDIELGSNVV